MAPDARSHTWRILDSSHLGLVLSLQERAMRATMNETAVTFPLVFDIALRGDLFPQVHEVARRAAAANAQTSQVPARGGEGGIGCVRIGCYNHARWVF